jgi:ribosomal protein L14E/L6E/L27E
MKKGAVVKAIAGRDSKGYFVVTDICGDYVMIADGKSRKLSSPKKKNPKHLRMTSMTVELKNITDKELRNVLSEKAHTP